MKRDMELMRKILFKIEDVYKPGVPSMTGFHIDGYDLPIVAEHCDLLYQKGLIKSYKPTYSHTDGISLFHIGNLTDRGFDYLELIRSDDVWQKTKTEIEEKKLPNTLETIGTIAAKIAGVFMGNFMKEFNG